MLIDGHASGQRHDIRPRLRDLDQGREQGTPNGRTATRQHCGVTCYNVFDPALPFGGYKQPGWGREMGLEVLSLYTQIKSACIRL